MQDQELEELLLMAKDEVYMFVLYNFVQRLYIIERT
jgi:hypothetical protein